MFLLDSSALCFLAWGRPGAKLGEDGSADILDSREEKERQFLVVQIIAQILHPRLGRPQQQQPDRSHRRVPSAHASPENGLEAIQAFPYALL